MRWIATNAGHEGAIVVQRVKDMKGDEGFNAQTEQYENLVKAGVIDPTKVVRSALQNAASIASLLLTTEAVISQAPDEHQGSGRRARWLAAWAEGCTRGMGPLRELLATDHRQALEFFFQRLKDVSGPGVDRAGAALQRQRAGALRPGLHAGRSSSSRRRRTSARSSIISWSTRRCAHDSLMMETAGAQCLVLAGFFEDQMRRRHNIRWYAELGAGFFSRAAQLEPSPQQGPAARHDRQSASRPGVSATRGSAATCATSPFC